MTDSNDTLFFRNWKPNTVIVRFAGQRYSLARRGTREDTLALPVEASRDKTIARWLLNGTLEEITEDQFMELAVRQLDVTSESGRTAELKPQAREVNIPINKPDSSTPTIIADNLFDKKIGKDLMSPRLEYMEEPLTTEEELKDVKKEVKPVRARRKTSS